MVKRIKYPNRINVFTTEDEELNVPRAAWVILTFVFCVLYWMM